MTTCRQDEKNIAMLLGVPPMALATGTGAEV